MLIYIFIVLLVGIIVWRVILPNMKLESHKTPATGAGTSTTTPTTGKSIGELATEYMWSILIVIVGAVLVYWGLQNTQIRPTDAGSWGWTNWLPLIIFWGVAATLIAINADGKTATILQKVLAGVMLALLIVFPVIHGIWGESSSSQQTKQQTLPIPSNGESPHLPTKPGYAIEWTGSGFTIHCVYRDGSSDTGPCRNGPMLYQYLKDTSGKPNIASYEFVRP